MTEIKLSPDGRTVTVFVPLTLRRRGGRKVIVAPAGCTGWAPPPKIDRALLKALARAHRWQGLLEEGRFGTLGSSPMPSGSVARTSAASCVSRSSLPTSSNGSSTDGQRQGSRSSCSPSRSSGSDSASG